jgi:hypothetical protein
MGVYIKGMEMPDSCDVCRFSDWSNLHQTARCKILEYKPCFNDFSMEYQEKRSKLCPLVEVPEPHGRLIDADALADDLDYDANHFEEEHEMKSNCASWLRSKNTLTVIEAEGE